MIWLLVTAEDPTTKLYYKITVSISYIIHGIGPSGVGIVFYITDGGLHGLEAAPSLWNGGSGDPGSAWITGGATRTTLNGNTATAIGTGLANSNYIINQSGHTGSAAKLCRDYNGGGYDDWFLPSKDELNQMYVNLHSQGVGGLGHYSFWSSSEVNDENAWYQDFPDGFQASNYYGKPAIHRVRAVRAF